MSDQSGAKTTIAPMLSVRNGAQALEFYKEAFGAEELFKIENGGSVVATLAVNGAEFWVADESPEHLNFSPETLAIGRRPPVGSRGMRSARSAPPPSP